MTQEGKPVKSCSISCGPVSGWSDEDMEEAYSAGFNLGSNDEFAPEDDTAKKWVMAYKELHPPTPNSGQQEGEGKEDVGVLRLNVYELNELNKEVGDKLKTCQSLYNNLALQLKSKDKEINKLVEALNKVMPWLILMPSQKGDPFANAVSNVKSALQPYIKSLKTDI